MDTLNAPRHLRLHASDNVIVAVDSFQAGQSIEGVTVTDRVPRGHKLASRLIAAGEPVRKFGQIIGSASRRIEPGEWVHEHNLSYSNFVREAGAAHDAHASGILPADQRATFEGFRRANGRAGTRNYIGVLTSVNCSASVARFIAEAVQKSGILDDYPMVDGIIPLVHGGGCALDVKGEGYEVLKRTQWGYATNPNIAAVLMVGLGCEGFQIGRWKEAYNIVESDTFRSLTIQEVGGTRKTMEAGVAAIREMLPTAANVKRETIPASELMLALQCGGSDGYSGITANPALGAAVDLLVQHGGTAILSETPEIYGAEHLLIERASNPEAVETAAIGHRLVGRLYGPQQDGDEQQSFSRQQGRWFDHYSREVAGCRGEIRDDTTRSGLRLRRAGHGAWPRFHGHARLRSRFGNRAGCWRSQCAGLHHRTRFRLWLQADAIHKACHQHAHVQSDDRGYGYQLWRRA